MGTRGEQRGAGAHTALLSRAPDNASNSLWRAPGRSAVPIHAQHSALAAPQAGRRDRPLKTQTDSAER